MFFSKFYLIISFLNRSPDLEEVESIGYFKRNNNRRKILIHYKNKFVEPKISVINDWVCVHRSVYVLAFIN
jgi:hypothetical protein